MAMEELMAVQELEKRLAEQYAAAQAECKRRVAVEQRACARLLEDNFRNGEVEARRAMAEAERRAAEDTAQTLARAQEDCGRMQQAAREHLAQAAQWSMEEVVRNEWRS